LNSEEALATLQAKILETEFGIKKYNGGSDRMFTMLGARFTLDNWAASKFVFPSSDLQWQDQQVSIRKIFKVT
jgi:hypothetical protein